MIFIRKAIITKGVVLGGLALLSQSCFVAKDYKRPSLEETEALYRTDLLPADSLSMADLSWRDLFLDGDLNRCIEEGLKHNLDVRLALQQIKAAEAYMKQGKAGVLPAFEVNTSLTHQELSENGQFGPLFNGSVNQYELAGTLSWEADIWGKIRSNARAARASYLQSVASHQAVKTQLVSSIASTYYRLLALDAQLNVTETSIAAWESSVRTIKAQKDAGQVTQVAVDQNIAQLNNAKALLVDLKLEIFKSENTLNLLLGRPSQVILRGALDDQVLDPGIQIGVPLSLLSNRPDVRASEYRLIEAFEMTNVARSKYYPALTLSATGGVQSLQSEKLFNSTSLFATLIGGIAQPVLNRRKIKTEHEVALAQQEQALLNFKNTLFIAGQEVSNAFYDYEVEMEKSIYLQREVSALQNAERDSEELLKNGYADYLDLLTARQSALSSQFDLINNKLRQMLSVVNLYEALGGGWK